MKNLILALVIILCAQSSAISNIVNGYLRDKQLLENEIRKSLVNYNDATCRKDSILIEKKLKKIRKEYAGICKKYSETEQLIQDIQAIDPELFEAVSNVTNADGTITHVYVRYTQRTSKEICYLFEGQFKAFGYTSVMQDKKNENVCTSYFGANTINVVVCKGCDDEFVLAHEFGHVLYIVPNLVDYVRFTEEQDKFSNAISHTGHNAFDPSNEIVKSVVDSFSVKYEYYKKGSENHKTIETNLVSIEH
jgi:hypothetical protein